MPDQETSPRPSDNPGYEASKGHESMGGVDDVRHRAAEVGETLRDRAESRVESERRVASEKGSALARALREASESLDAQGETRLARYGWDTADRIEEWSSQLGDKPVRRMVEDLESMGRRNPAAFLGSSFTAGLLLGRFLRASADDSDRRSRESARRDERETTRETERDMRAMREQERTELRYE